MNSNEISTFTRRITESNRSELIVVLYDIFFAYANEAIESLEEIERLGKKCDEARIASERGRIALKKAGLSIEHLKGALDYKYELSSQLYPLYDYAERMAAKSIYTERVDGIKEAMRILSSLREAFVEVAKQDTSAPLMQNTEKVSAGYTYGRYDINEVTSNYDNARGFFA